jgi:hypothetical protein
MGSYQATLIAGQTLEFTIPAPCYKFQATNVGALGGPIAYVTGDGTQPVVPSAETVTPGTQVAVPTGGGPIPVRTLLPGSALGGPGPAGPTGTTYPTVLLLSSGTPTVIVEW